MKILYRQSAEVDNKKIIEAAAKTPHEAKAAIDMLSISVDQTTRAIYDADSPKEPANNIVVYDLMLEAFNDTKRAPRA